MPPAMIHCNEPSRNEVQSSPTADAGPIADLSLCPHHRGLAALRYLAEAASFARELGRDAWDFAVEIQTFRELGLTSNDFRWLVCKGLVQHKQEITSVGDRHRVFRPDRPLSFSANACFVLSEAGLAYASSGLISLEGAARKPAFLNGMHAAADSSPTVCGNGHGKDQDLLPKWDRERQELRLGDLVVKQFKVPALNQERILTVFEEEGWPVVIDDPLPPHPEQDSKRRLHDTIISLNRNQKNPLIHFLGNGNGQGIRWRPSPGRNGEAVG